MMWVPMVVSAAALAAGLVGIALAGDWRLLLVVAAATGLSETVGFIRLTDVLMRNRKEFDEHHARVCDKMGVKVDPGKMIGWIEAVIAAFVTFTSVVMAMILMARFSTSFADARWMKVCLFLGCACVPWCYRSHSADDRFRKWSIFAVAACAAACLAVFPGWPLMLAADFALLLFPLHLVRQWLLGRKGVAA